MLRPLCATTSDLQICHNGFGSYRAMSRDREQYDRAFRMLMCCLVLLVRTFL